MCWNLFVGWENRNRRSCTGIREKPAIFLDFGVQMLNGELRLPGTPSLVFVFYVLVLLPWLALRSTRRLRQNPQLLDDLRVRRRIWRSSIVMLLLLLWMATATGWGFGYSAFRGPADLPGTVSKSLLCLVACLALLFGSSRLRTPQQRRQMFVYRFVPGTGADWVLKIALAVTAGISEEVVYRGVLVQILWYSLGEFWLAIGISAIGFVLAHRQQGLQSMLVILTIALLMQWLVQSTGTLLGAMVVHALYDIIAMVVIARQSARDAPRPDASGQ